MPTLEIDGRKVEVADGHTVIQAADQAGIEIPHYCWHPGLSVAANCRMCLVEILPPPLLDRVRCSRRSDGTEGALPLADLEARRSPVVAPPARETSIREPGGEEDDVEGDPADDGPQDEPHAGALPPPLRIAAA